MKEAQRILLEALEREAEAQRLLLAGDEEDAVVALREVSALYRRSWKEAPPGAYGRLMGMLKAAILAGDGAEEAAFARAELGEADTPAGAYVIALAALVEGDDEAALAAARTMAGEGDAFARAAAAIEALAAGDATRYAEAVGAVVRDFEARSEHVTGVPIADTALVLDRLAGRRGLAAQPKSRLMPQPRE